MEKVWKKPDQGVVKINFDASPNGRKMSFGLVARDHDGFVLGGRAGNGLSWNLKPIVPACYLFAWAPRSCNKATDSLCKWAKALNCIKDFDRDYPIEIHDVILIDAMN
ncbi:hypothetical protein PVK06_044396 [Gossypium arboreum]|uniref:RNase H type-1 domain-containing protein n=1 Tax=Gossypium arboreum TaxID=29729 RepID=A0ABR0MRJ7_GOSAR|nr:hypothetical protein PVK06_044396 [Gossypium arboreum]